MLSNVMPDIQSWQDGIEDESGGTLCVLTLGGLYESVRNGRRGGGNDDFPMFVEKSDHFIVAEKLGNASRAKEVMD